MEQILNVLAEALGDGVRVDELTRMRHGRDAWARSELSGFVGDSGPLPMAVVFPADTARMARAVRICRDAGVRMVPRGAGSGLSGGVHADARSIVLATDRLVGMRACDPLDRVASFGAGTLGSAAEEAVAERGFSLPHRPLAMGRSSVGGWVATRSSGALSTGYGNIEDLVVGLEAVLPDGTVFRSRTTPRASTGPDLRQLLIGSEGTLGIVTEVSVSLRSPPEQSLRRAYHFEHFAAGVDALRAVMGPGWRPHLVRLLDARESRRRFRDACPSGRCALLLLHEGPAPRAEVEAAAVRGLCLAHGGEPLPAEFVDAWFELEEPWRGRRQLHEEGLVADTIELAAGWSRLTRLHEAVGTALRSEPSLLSAGAEIAHAYPSGASLSVSFLASPERSSEMLEVHDRCWALVMRATRDVGAGIAHHQGIGRARRDWLPGELGPGAVRMLRSIKRVLDPDDLMNPGVLIPTG